MIDAARQIGWLRRAAATALLVVCVDLAPAAEEKPAAETEAPGPTVISASEAQNFVGEEVVVHGQILATHASPLSTLLSFRKDFNGLVAVIRPADRDAFPPAPEEHYRGKWVRVKGRLAENGKKIRIALTNPSQIQTVEGPAPASPPQTDAEANAQMANQLVEHLTNIEGALRDITERLELILAALSEPPAQEGETAPQPRLFPGRIASPPATPPRAAYETLRTVKRGMSAEQVVRLAGEPTYIDPGSQGGETWYYGAGRSITFNERGRVESLVGFRR
jgi:hypothetical protein